MRCWSGSASNGLLYRLSRSSHREHIVLKGDLPDAVLQVLADGLHCGHAQHQRSPLPPLRQHRPATRQRGGRPQRLTKVPADVLDHATSEIAIGSKLSIGATKKLPGEGFKRPWPPLIKKDESVKANVERPFNP